MIHRPTFLRFLVTAFLVTVMALALPAGATQGTNPTAASGSVRQPHAGDRIIVGFKPGLAPAGRSRGIASVEPTDVEPVSPLADDTVVVHLAEGRSVADAIRGIEGRPGVAFVEPDYLVQAAGASDDPWYVRGDQWGVYGKATTPANPYGSAAGEAWAQGHVGSASIVVGIVDEGIKTTHPDLAPNVWDNPWESINGRDDDGNGYVDDIHGWDFVHGDASVYDGTSDDHGTHVAGIVGARGGNGRGVAGVNWRVTLLSAKFLGPGGGYVSDAIAAIDYLTDLKVRHGLDIVALNNSWSGGGFSTALDEALARAGDANILFVAAAGNEGRDIDGSPAYPASYRCDTRADGSERGWDCLIAVANIDAAGDRASDSNHGPESVDLGAPGTAVASTDPDGDDGYAYASGTSMAAPHVSGAIALCASLDSGLSARQIRERVLGSARPTAALSGSTVTGGRLDIGELVERCRPTPTPTPAPAPPSEVVLVDDRDPAFERTGPGWRQGWVGYAQHHYWLPTRQEARRNVGEWRPTLARDGWYDVRVYIPTAHATTKHAVYKVSTADGWATRVRNQAKWRGKWISLGRHWLTTQPVVRLSDRTGENATLDLKVAFDAIRFIPLDETG